MLASRSDSEQRLAASGGCCGRASRSSTPAAVISDGLDHQYHGKHEHGVFGLADLNSELLTERTQLVNGGSRTTSPGDDVLPTGEVAAGL
jgi:hypothetical protein